MIARRFGALYWVGGISVAATGLYLVSLQVAAERAKLDRVEARIVAAQREMQALQTELGSRSSMRQLEKWNAEVLALSAPKAKQYIHDSARLAMLADMAPPGPKAEPAAPVALAAATLPGPRVASPVKVVHASYDLPAATAPTPTPKPKRIAMIDRAVLTRATLTTLSETASAERRKRP